MSRFTILRQIMNQHRYRLVLTYILFSIEMIGNLLRPFFLGDLADGALLVQSFPVGAIGHHGVKGVGDADDPGV